MTERICNRCKELKPLSRFAVRTDWKNQLRTICMDCTNEKTRIVWRKLRREIFDHYGWSCKCCGETIKEFLSLDHINNDGYLDRNPGGSKKSGKELYLLVKKQGFPDTYQTLCMNCNWGKKVGNGICPHQHYKSILDTGKQQENVKSKSFTRN